MKVRVAGAIGALAMTILALTGAPGAAQDEPPPLTVTFGDFMVACDNTRACTAVGFADGAAGGAGPHLYIRRQAGSTGETRVEIGIGYSGVAEALKNGDRIEVAVDGPHALRFTTVVRRGRESWDWPELVFPVERTDAFLRAIVDGGRVSLSSGGVELGAASLKGSSAALRYMDDRQQRAGTVTALVARGPKPGSAVPRAPALPAVRRAPAVSQAGLPTELPPALAAREDVRDCAIEYDEPRAPGVARLSATEYLWQVACGAGAYNFNTLFIIARRDGSGARSPRFFPRDPDFLINGVYDPKLRQMRAFAKGRGLGDCGEDAAWTWDGREFRLVRHAVMEECLGVTAEHWITIYRARTTG